MEYFAKSKKRELSLEEKKKLQDLLKNLEVDLQEELQDWERDILDQAQQKIVREVKEEQKTLGQHLEETERCAQNFFEQYGQYFEEKEKILVLLACRYHDIGKANAVFQNIVNPNMEKKIKNARLKNIPHGYLSVLPISKQEFLKEYPEMTENDFRSMITAIYYHHTREDEYSDTEIKEYSRKYYEENIREFLGQPMWETSTRNRGYLIFSRQNTKRVSESQWNQYILLKGMLNKFDWIVSAGYEQAEINPDLRKKELKTNIEKDRTLRPVQVYMKTHKDDNLIIIAPTGSGKTEASLLWLNGEKGFYTLPLKVASNAIYDRIRKQYCFKDVSLLHSESMTKYLQEFSSEREKNGYTENEEKIFEEDGYTKYERAKFLSGPLTICTVDQLFKFVYKALGTEIFAATLKYSKVILDEIQAYSPRVIATLIFGLRTITQMGGSFAIVTATFPSVLESFMKKYGLIRDEQYKFCDFCSNADLLRHRFIIRKGEIDVEAITQDGIDKKVLVICNTVTKAQKIYEQIEEEGGEVFLLHSKYIRKHKTILEERIKQFSQNEKAKGIWVTTQVVEASLDIDFDILYTEMSCADSLLQRMGRCNRAARYFPEEANIIIFDDENGVGGVYDRDIYARSVQYLYQYEDVVFTEKMKIDYINQVYNEEEIRETKYYKKIEDFLEHLLEIDPLDYDSKEASEEFRDIRSISVMPDCIYDQCGKFLEVYRAIQETPHIGKEIRALLNSKLEDMTVGINLYGNKKYPEYVDHSVIKGTNIHTSSLYYDFNLDTCTGKGLVMKKEEDDSCII